MLDMQWKKGKSLLGTRHWKEAEEAFRDVTDEDETNAAAALGLVESLVMQGKGNEALAITKNFPAGTEWATIERLKPLANLMAQVEENGPYPEDDPLEAEFFQAARLLVKGNMPAGLDGLLDILRQDKKYRNGEPKDVLLAIFELLGQDDPVTREYRNELASVLF